MSTPDDLIPCIQKTLLPLDSHMPKCGCWAELQKVLAQKQKKSFLIWIIGVSMVTKSSQYRGELHGNDLIRFDRGHQLAAFCRVLIVSLNIPTRRRVRRVFLSSRHVLQNGSSVTKPFACTALHRCLDQVWLQKQNKFCS